MDICAQGTSTSFVESLLEHSTFYDIAHQLWENNSNLIKKNLTIVSTHYRYGIHIIWLVMLVRSEISKVNAKDVRCLMNKCVYIWPLTIDFIRSCVTSSYIFNKLTPSSVSNLKCLYRFLSHSFSFPSIPNYSLPFLGNTHGR